MTALSEAPHQPIGEIVVDWQEPPFPARGVLQGRFCRLEPLDVSKHAEQLFAANALDSHGANWTYLPYGPFESFAEYRAWLEQQSSMRDPLFFAIVDSTSGEAIGVASYLRISPSSGSIEVGHLNFSPKLQRTPAATATNGSAIRSTTPHAKPHCVSACPSKASSTRRRCAKAATATPHGTLRSTKSGLRFAQPSIDGSARRISMNRGISA
jgi:RimJ/RimL family protein N-acetyltransferase